MTFMQKGSGSALGQQGLVSFMVTLIMMIVITLIVIGFTQVTIRARGEAIDRQLSEQAFYAAESGVNKAVNKIKSLGGSSIPDQSGTCNGPDYPTGAIGSSPNVAITCLLVKPVVEDIRFAANQTSSTVVKLDTYEMNGVSPTNLTQIEVTWAAARGMSTDVVSDCADYDSGWPVSIGSCGFGVIRLDLMHFERNNNNLPPSGDTDTNTETFYLKPAQTAGAIPEAGSQKAHIGTANCLSGECKILIDLNGNFSTKRHYARISTLYRDSPVVKIDGTANGGDSANFAGVQALIDSTGRAQDVLRRVQVRYPTGIIHSPTPPAALESEVKICKRFTTSPTSFDLDAECL